MLDVGYERKRSQDLWHDQLEEWSCPFTNLGKVFGQEDRQFGFGFRGLRGARLKLGQGENLCQSLTLEILKLRSNMPGSAFQGDE